MLARTATRLLTSTAVTAAAVASMLGVAGPAAAARAVTVTLTVEVSGAYVVARTPMPINSVDLRILNRAGQQIGRRCFVQADPGSDDIDRRTITPAGGYDVSVPAGGRLEGRAAASGCLFEEPAAAPTVVRVGRHDAAVAWYLHP
jgi:hypothetical protein